MTRTLLICSLLAGCGPALEIDEAALRGSLGDVQGFDAPVEEPYSYGDWFRTSVSLSATDAEGRWVLGRLQVPHDFVEWETGVYEDRVDILGCSTIPEPGHYMYDRYADHTQLEIQEGDTPDVRRLIYTGTWDDGEAIYELTGELDYVVLP